jgi:hypothetical protein
MPVALSVKVPVAKLIELGEAKRARIVKDHQKLKQSSTSDITKARKKLAAELRKTATAVSAGRAGKLTSSYRGTRSDSHETRVIEVRAQVDIGPVIPSKPPIERVDKLLAMLRATSQEEMTVRDDSPLAYLIDGAAK